MRYCQNFCVSKVPAAPPAGNAAGRPPIRISYPYRVPGSRPGITNSAVRSVFSPAVRAPVVRLSPRFPSGQ